jgi:hypothetical protein
MLQREEMNVMGLPDGFSLTVFSESSGKELAQALLPPAQNDADLEKDPPKGWTCMKIKEKKSKVTGLWPCGGPISFYGGAAWAMGRQLNPQANANNPRFIEKFAKRKLIAAVSPFFLSLLIRL